MRRTRPDLRPITRSQFTCRHIHREVSDRVSESRSVLATGETRTQQPDPEHQPSVEGASAPPPSAVISTAAVSTLGTLRRRLPGILADYSAAARSWVLADR